MLALRFQIGPHRVALDIRQVREVVPRVALQPLAGAPPWLAGTMVYRGRAVAVIDLARLLGASEPPSHLSTRIILVPWRDARGEETLLGLLAARVAEVRELPPAAGALPALHTGGQFSLGEARVVDGMLLHLLDLDRLLPEPLRSPLALEGQ